MSKFPVSDQDLVDLPLANRLEWLQLHGDELTVDGAKQIAKVVRLQTVGLSGNKLGHDAFKTLLKLPAVENISIQSSQITEIVVDGHATLRSVGYWGCPVRRIYFANLPSFAKDGGMIWVQRNDEQLSIPVDEVALINLPHLRAVEFYKQPLSENAILTFNDLPSLRRFNLCPLAVRNQLDMIRAKCPKLYAVGLGEPEIIDQDLEHVTIFKSLRCLELSDSKITDTGLRHVANLQDLEVLDLQNTATSSAGIQYIHNLKSLRELYLFNTKVDDQAVSVLKDLPNLKKLNVTKGAISLHGIAELKKNERLEIFYVVSEGQLPIDENGMPSRKTGR